MVSVIVPWAAVTRTAIGSSYPTSTNSNSAVTLAGVSSARRVAPSCFAFMRGGGAAARTSIDASTSPTAADTFDAPAVAGANFRVESVAATAAGTPAMRVAFSSTRAPACGDTLRTPSPAKATSTNSPPPRSVKSSATATPTSVVTAATAASIEKGAPVCGAYRAAASTQFTESSDARRRATPVLSPGGT